MIRATLKLLPEEADALILFLAGHREAAPAGTHLWRVLGYVGDAVKHERARAGYAR